MRRHSGWLALALIAGTLSAVAVGHASGLRLPRCEARALTLSGGLTSGAAGSLLAQYELINHSSRSCTLRGYPQVQMLDAAGHALRTLYSHAPSGAAGVRVATVTLTPGRGAWFAIDYATATGFAGERCPTAARLRVTPPQLSQSLVLGGRAAHITPYGGSTVHLLCGEIHVTPLSAKPIILAR